MNGKRILIAVAASALLSACVDHRPIRNGLDDEAVYLTKSSLTAPNPLVEGSTDEGWLFKVTTVKSSSPNVMGDVVFPGLEGELKYVKLRFQESGLQILDGRSIQRDDPEDPNDDLATQAERVLFEFAGKHVDIKLRESLDGERTNYLEENTEKPWRDRQNFKVDFENTSMEPASQLLWVYGLYANLCAVPLSSNLVPDSFEWDESAQSLGFTIDVTYQLNWLGWVCTDLLHLYERDAQTGNVQYHFALFRRGESDFVPQIIDEKDLVNKKYGAFQVANTFRDHDTGLVGNVNLLHRWNPNRPENDPVVFYFHEGFPEAFKPMWTEIRELTNAVMAEAGATLRFDFRDCLNQGKDEAIPDDCQRPTFGDPRYSFVVWHHSIDTTTGLLGYGPSISDPRTGEIISATTNLYNVGLDRYRFYIQDYLEQHGGLLKPEADKAWEETVCTEGATVAPGDPVRCALIAEGAKNECEASGGESCDAVRSQTETECKQSPRLNTQLFAEMRRVMDLEDGADGSADDFVPQPLRDGFRDDYHKVLGELRYSYPPWNRFVYRTDQVPFQMLQEMQQKEGEFQNAMQDVMAGKNPFGAQALYTREGIEAQLGFTQNMRDWRKNHAELQHLKDFLFSTKSIYTFDPNDAINAIAMGARRCVQRGSGFTWESDKEYSDRIIEAVVFHVAIHEFGHNLSLRHNFYGSVDGKHMREGEVSASIMDYVTAWEEAGSSRGYGQYDEWALKWIYGGDDVRAEAMQQDILYCTDEHRILSPLCRAHDLGITPAQITLNAIEQYDWLYNLRNRRAYRKFWDTSSYVGSVYGAMFDIQRMWHLGIFDWGGGGVQETLKRLDQVGGGTVLTDPEYDEIAVDFYNDISASIGMTMAFYDAVINQPASFRNYQTEYDPFYGDILRLGIIIDKLFSTVAYMDLQDIYYSPNVAAYVSMWDAPFGSQNLALSQRVLDNMLGANYDTFAWFKYYALAIFASTSNTNLVGSIETKERIAIERYENEMELREAYGDAAIDYATRVDNPQQTFVYDSELYVYTYLPDRNWHLVARASRSPVSYQYLREYNESLNAGADPDLDNYGLKILLAYYEYFNNFVGF
ncbi:MAG: zinc-dependent metalloprotease [Myxococcales bacterium]|nr:zinc-dependent metalloprotease [Myxococcales bacterium]